MGFPLFREKTINNKGSVTHYGLSGRRGMRASGGKPFVKGLSENFQLG
jgi:hypothetical protein